MYHLNLLSIILIIVAFFIFYNECNKKLSYTEIILLTIAFVAVIRGAYNYIQIDNNNNK